MGRFDDDIAVVATGAGRYDTTITADHWVVAGPNGGYLAAVLTHAAEVELGEPDRQLRSLTVHYLRPPSAGPATVDVEVVQRGRSVAFCRITMTQADRVVLLATGAWATPREGADLDTWPRPPALPAPADCPTLAEVRRTEPLAIHRQWDIRAARASMFGSADRAEMLWWIRPAHPRPLDGPMLVAVADALPPPIFATLADPMGVPTVDLTVHVRAQLDQVGWEPGDWLLVRFASQLASSGFIEEDGEIWTPDGTLLAHSRQLALAV